MNNIQWTAAAEETYLTILAAVLNKHCSFTYQVEGNDIKIIAFYYNKMNWQQNE